MTRSEDPADLGILDISMADRIPVFVYHKVDPRFEFSISRISPRRFESHLDWLCREGYRTITITEASQMVRNGDPLPEKTVALVFDDGFDSVYRYAWPLLKQRNMTATVYIIAGFAGSLDSWDVKIGWRRFRHLSWEQVRSLGDSGIEIGSHSLNHPDLTRLGDDALRFELQESRSVISENTGLTARSFSIPFGRCTPREAIAISDSGYESYVVVRNHDIVKHDLPVIGYQGACLYATTRYTRMDETLRGTTPSCVSRWVDRGVGWCASRTPLVKGRPSYPEQI